MAVPQAQEYAEVIWGVKPAPRPLEKPRGCKTGGFTEEFLNENCWFYLPKMVILPSKDGHFASKHAGGVFCDVFLPAKAWWFLFKKKTRCLSQHKLWLYEQRWGFKRKDGDFNDDFSSKKYMQRWWICLQTGLLFEKELVIASKNEHFTSKGCVFICKDSVIFSSKAGDFYLQRFGDVETWQFSRYQLSRRTAVGFFAL